MTTAEGTNQDCYFAQNWNPYEKPGSQLFTCETKTKIHVHVKVQCVHEMRHMILPIGGVLDQIAQTKALYTCTCFMLPTGGKP